LSAERLVSMFTSRGYPAAFMARVNQGLREMDQEGYSQLYDHIFTKIRANFQHSDFSIFDNAADQIDVLNNMFQAAPELKQQFMTLKTPDVAQWIPGPGGINLEKGIGSCTGDLLEYQSILGPFLSISFLPSNLNFNVD